MINQSQRYQHDNLSTSIGTMIPIPDMAQSGNSSLLINQVHRSGQFSGQVPNSLVNSLSVMPQQKGGSIPRLIQNSAVRLPIDQDFLQVRKSIQKKIYEFPKHHNHELTRDKVVNIVRRLEEGLFKTATTKEEYMNLETLKNRLKGLIKRQSQLHQHSNPSSSIGTMKPTPGMAQSGNSSLLAASSSLNTGSLVPNATGPSGGPKPNGYQQSPSSYSIKSGGNSMISSMGAQRMPMACNLQMVNGSGTSEGNSSKSFPQHCGQHQRQMLQGDGYARKHVTANVTQVSGNMSREQIVQEDFRQRIAGQDQAQQNNLSSEGSLVYQTVTSRAAEPPNPSGGMCRPGDPNRNRQRWLLLLLHARHCNHPAGKCLAADSCTKAQELLKHVHSCKVHLCLHPRCHLTKDLIIHYRKCKDEGCAVCGPVKRRYVIQTPIPK